MFVRFFRESGECYHKKKEKSQKNTQSKLETQEEMSDVLGELVPRLVFLNSESMAYL
jgi:hypothetical protein